MRNIAGTVPLTYVSVNSDVHTDTYRCRSLDFDKTSMRGACARMRRRCRTRMSFHHAVTHSGKPPSLRQSLSSITGPSGMTGTAGQPQGGPVSVTYTVSDTGPPCGWPTVPVIPLGTVMLERD